MRGKNNNLISRIFNKILSYLRLYFKNSVDTFCWDIVKSILTKNERCIPIIIDNNVYLIACVTLRVYNYRLLNTISIW